VSRGPGPVDFRGPLFHDGALGPCTRSSVTASLPTSVSSRPRIDDDISRIWVVHAVESARTVRTPSLNVTGLQCSATFDPTMSAQRPITAPTATSTFHPRSSSRRSIWSPSNDGSRPDPVAPAEPAEPWPCWPGARRLRIGLLPGRRPLARAASRARAKADAAATSAVSAAGSSTTVGVSLVATSAVATSASGAAPVPPTDTASSDTASSPTCSLWRRRPGRSSVGTGDLTQSHAIRRA